MARRVAIVTLLLAALFAAFSLRAVPEGLRGNLSVDVFDASSSAGTASQLLASFPDRKAGSDQDTQMAAEIARKFRAVAPTARIRRTTFSARTADGRKRLTQVQATVPGEPGPSLVVVAHRDALKSGSAAELTATAALINIARTINQVPFQHTIHFISTSSGSGGGLGGAAHVNRMLRGQDIRSVLVLGTMTKYADASAKVVPWVNRGLPAAAIYTRTIGRSLNSESLGNGSEPGIWQQVARRGLPASSGEQAVFGKGEFPAALIGSGGERLPDSNMTIDPESFGSYVRAAAKSLHAFDRTSVDLNRDRGGLAISGKILPLWALRILLMVLLLPAVAIVVARGLAHYREDQSIAAGMAWLAGCAAGPLVAGLVAIALSRIGLLSPRVPGPLSGPAIDVGIGTWILMLLIAATLIGTIALATVDFVNNVGQRRSTRLALASAVLVTMFVLELVVIWRNPVSGILLLPAVVTWPLAIMPALLNNRVPAPVLAAIGWVLPLAALATVAGALHVSFWKVPWWLALLTGGGQITPTGLMLTSIALGAGIATSLSILGDIFKRRDRKRIQAQPPRRRPTGVAVTSPARQSPQADLFDVRAAGPGDS